MPALALARHAMNTRFELVLHGREPGALRAAGEEALDEIERLEDRLSLFRASSEIARLNARAASEPVRVSPEVFHLLQHAQRLCVETGGVFDITIAPLMRCWGFREGAGQVPSPEMLAEVRRRVGMHLVELNAADYTVRFAREGVMLDLGAIGKGYAIDEAAQILREAGVTSALLHGGTSSAYALGRSPDGQPWKIGIPDPRVELASPPEAAPGSAHQIYQLGFSQDAAQAALDREPLAVVALENESLSLSAVWGRFFRDGARTYGHVIDPRSGQPAHAAVLAAVVLPSAAESDALSTALLTLGAHGLDLLARLRPDSRLLVVGRGRDGARVTQSRGIDYRAG